MAVQSAVLLIADIGGYTRFMKFHTASLIHAQDIVAQLLEAVIGAARPALRLAKIEGDAAFFYMPYGPGAAPEPSRLAAPIEAMYSAFHATLDDLRTNTLCPCDGCRQAGRLRIKMVGHAGDIVTRRMGGSTELAGIDVILVHRLLKNDVPLPEYLLMTEAVYSMLDAPRRERAAALAIELDDLGRTPAWYVALSPAEVCAPAASRLPLLRRLVRHVRLIGRTMPYLFSRRQPCAGFRNVPDVRNP